MVTLSEMQGKVLEFIFRHIRDTGAPPTLREIATHFEWKAVGSAQDVVAALRKKGLLAASESGKSRQLIPTAEASEHVPSSLVKKSQTNATASRAARASMSAPPGEIGVAYIPVLGLVQAGSPIESIETADKHIPFPMKDTRQDREFFALLIEGYSMLNAGFLPGDYVLVEASENARNGEIVVASIKGQATVKRLALRGSHLYRQAMEGMREQDRDGSGDGLPPALLLPENADFEPIQFGGDDGERIVGIVKSLFRKEVT